MTQKRPAEKESPRSRSRSRRKQRGGIIRDDRGQEQPETKEDAQRSSGHVYGDEVLKDTPL